jgi:dTDP-glucose 4,6-dehydratase
MTPNPLASDLDHVLRHTEGLWEELHGRRIFVTGGTGFLGCWLLESFAWANAKLGLNAEAVVLTRDPAVFRQKTPRLAADPALRFHAGDIRTYEFPPGRFDAILHAATEPSSRIKADELLRMFDSIVKGTERTLEFARQCGARKFLLLSSGSVYGRQPDDMPLIPEEYAGAPDPTDIRSAYGTGKRAAEQMCALYSTLYGLETKIARCFSVVGPYLPLDIHYATGNFIRDGLRGGPIQVQGDGMPQRSYLYAADLAIWLWTILFRAPSCRPYNVGSEEAISVKDLAYLVADLFPGSMAVEIAKQPASGIIAERYIPCTARARSELQLEQRIPLQDALRATLNWNKP